MSEREQLVEAAAQFLLGESNSERFDVALVVGSGWSEVISALGKPIAHFNAQDVAGFSESVVPGHSGTLHVITLDSGKRLLVIASRTHLYEDKGVDAVVHPIRVAAKSGVQTLVLTNGAGGIKTSWTPGTPVLISDHINLTGVTPLKGPRFIDMTDVYSHRLREIAREVDPTLDEGVYVQFRGPQYETPAEVQMARTLGGHIVGMSTALEAIAAREAGLEVLGLSLITNLAAGISDQPLSHEEVVEAGRAAGPVISNLLAKILQKL